MNDLYKNIKKISDQAIEINNLAIKNMPETLTFSNKLKEIISKIDNNKIKEELEGLL